MLAAHLASTPLFLKSEFYELFKKRESERHRTHPTKQGEMR